jgi:hypothetical protein
MADSHAITSLGIDEILLTTARGVIRAQQAMDASSLASEIAIREAGLDEQYGISARWYTIPELDFALRLAFRVGSGGSIETDMVDADYQSRYGFDVEASSTLTTKILAVPPPEGRGISLCDERDVQQIAGRIKAIVEAWDRAETPRFLARYRAFASQGYAGGLWQVLLLDSTDSGTLLRAWIAIDDATHEVVRLWTDADPKLDPPPPTPPEAPP